MVGLVAIGTTSPLSLLVRAQTQGASATQAFEAASVKRAAPPNGPLQVRMGGGPGRIAYTNATLQACIQRAYQVKSYQVSGPDWIGSERYTIEATAASAVSTEQLMSMLQALLADRFKLTLHRETRVLPGYVLVVAKSGAKLTAVKDDEQVATQIDTGANGAIAFAKASIEQLAGTLSRQLNMPVEDATGLKGVFNFSLSYAEMRAAPKPGEVDSDAPSLFTAVQEQLGLKLEARKTPVEILVIDHAEKVPSGN